jgi:HSP20 family protein
LSEDSWSRWFKRRSFSGGNLDISEAFKEIEEMLTKEIEKLSNSTSNNLIREKTLPNGTKLKSWGPFVYGYSMTIEPDGKPKIREFGNLNAKRQLEKPQIESKPEREPLTDIIEADDEVRVIVELPGVEKQNIELSGTNYKLTISVDTPQHKYFKEVEMPTKVDSEKATSEYRNGVLDITVPKTKEKEKKSRPIKIE